LRAKQERRKAESAGEIPAGSGGGSSFFTICGQVRTVWIAGEREGKIRQHCEGMQIPRVVGYVAFDVAERARAAISRKCTCLLTVRIDYSTILALWVRSSSCLLNMANRL
jgi:hypothetical protein